MKDNERMKMMLILSAMTPSSASVVNTMMKEREKLNSELFWKYIERRLEMLTEEDIENMI